MHINQYQQCSRCIMDNKSDQYISFNNNGHCNYCTQALEEKPSIYFPNSQGVQQLTQLINFIKNENHNSPYDCIMGISGGLDSSYLAYLGSIKWGLRILAVHIDDGFDTEVSQRNIDRIGEFTNLDLHIIKPDRLQFNELTKAYMRACVPNLAVPQDNVLFATIYNFMKENKIKFFLSGSNFSLESIIQRGNTHNAYDTQNIKAISRLFGKSIDQLTIISALQYDINSYIKGIKTLTPLNLIDYNRDNAMQELQKYCGFEYYGSKHLENTLTKFIQQYWFYNKFHVDKRTSHLSSMIISDQLSREAALNLYAQPLYDENEMQQTVQEVLKKLNLSTEEFSVIMKLPNKQHSDYPTSFYLKIKPFLAKIINVIFRSV